MRKRSGCMVVLVVGLVGGLGLAAGCQEETKPRGGYFATRYDRGLNVDSDSPSVPERSVMSAGATTGNLPDGTNAPRPAGLRDDDTPNAQSPAAARVLRSTTRPTAR